MEPIFDSTPTTAKQISDLFSNPVNSDSPSSSNDKRMESTSIDQRVLDQYALIKPDPETYSSLVNHINSKLFNGNGETLYQIGVNGKSYLFLTSICS